MGWKVTRGSGSLSQILIVEGSDDELGRTGMSWEAIQGALVTVSISFGIPVLRTGTAEETVCTMCLAAQQLRAQALGGLPRAGYRPRGKRARQLYILQGLPGIGPGCARRLLAHFPSVAAIIGPDADALRAVPGIGKGVAEKMRWAVEEDQAAYRSGWRNCLHDVRDGFVDAATCNNASRIAMG